MRAIENLLTVAQAYATAEKIPLQTVSWRVFNDSKRLSAIRNGADIQVRRFEQAMLWFSANWPPRTAWPKGVKRPRPEDAMS